MFFGVLLLLVLGVLMVGTINAQDTVDHWRSIGKDRMPRPAASRILPDQYSAFRLNSADFVSDVSALPRDRSAGRRQEMDVVVPMPDSSTRTFRVRFDEVLSLELAAENPTWRTFSGYDIEDPTVTGRFDWTILGFNGEVSSAKGKVIIEPFDRNTTEFYIAYYKHHLQNPNDFACKTRGDVESWITSSEWKKGGEVNEFSFGATVKTFRLAIATTGEWTRNAGNFPTVSDPVALRTAALAVITTAVNRLNGIFERELASRFVLVNPPVAGANNIIWDDPATDPYDNTDGIPQLGINQTQLDMKVTPAGYDVGHLFGTGGGGVASSPSLCSTQKAEGYSARGNNTGDPFVVDYVAHEIGHQFGANHTYNNSDPGGACTTRSAANAFEVASGATIMSYVGICSNRNLQQFVDTGFPSFHIRSLTEINQNLTMGEPAGCGTTAGTNNVPTVLANGPFTIPRLTPFTLTATANDADPADVPNLLYSWEQYDLAPSPSGTLGTPANTYDVDTDGVLRPLFRAYSPVGSNVRAFPASVFVLNTGTNDPAGSNQPALDYTGTHPTNAPGAVCEPMVTCVIGERLPTAARTMNFRVSVRDRRGGVADVGTTVTVAAGTGPFQITNQNSFAPQANWYANTTPPVTWDVAGTNAAPINVATVNILLSTDGGLTFPTVLAANTPNDGTQNITVPNIPTMQARVKVEAVGNIFYDINNANFAILPPVSASVSISGRVLTPSGFGVRGAVVRMTNIQGNTITARTNAFGLFRFEGIEVGSTYSVTVGSKLYVFEPRTITVSDEIVDLDFMASN